MTLAPNSSSRETAVDFAYKNQKCNSKRLLIGLIKKSTVKCKKSLIDERVQLDGFGNYITITDTQTKFSFLKGQREGDRRQDSIKHKVGPP